MPTAPDLPAVKVYLGNTGTWDDDELQSALLAETAAQARRVRFPADPPSPAAPLAYPADLAEALMRRVAHNLALRAIPLAVQATATDGFVATTRIGGEDPEVRRLEAPYRRTPIG